MANSKYTLQERLLVNDIYAKARSLRHIKNKKLFKKRKKEIFDLKKKLKGKYGS